MWLVCSSQDPIFSSVYNAAVFSEAEKMGCINFFADGHWTKNGLLKVWKCGPKWQRGHADRQKHYGESWPCSGHTVGLVPHSGLCWEHRAAAGCQSRVVATLLTAWLPHLASLPPWFFSASSFFSPVDEQKKSRRSEGGEWPFIDFANINDIHLLLWISGREMLLMAAASPG